VFRYVIPLCPMCVVFGGIAVSLAVQDPTERRSRPYGVPEADISGSPEEQTWWKELHDAGNNLRSTHRSGDKQKKKFATVLHDGQTRLLKPPITDSRPVILFRAAPYYTEEARQRGVRGVITLQVEFLPNGDIGDIKVIDTLGAGLDEAAVEAARKTIFLPAVKNREFVSASLRIVMHFNVY
jgi:TonB family protein